MSLAKICFVKFAYFRKVAKSWFEVQIFSFHVFISGEKVTVSILYSLTMLQALSHKNFTNARQQYTMRA